MREKRIYALFEKQNGRWVRISSFAYRKSSAVRIFQGALLAPFLGGESFRGVRSLRPVELEYDPSVKVGE